MRSRAHTLILGSGPRTASICEPCGLWAEHDRTEPAKTAVRTHNRNHHPEEIPA